MIVYYSDSVLHNKGLLAAYETVNARRKYIISGIKKSITKYRTQRQIRNW